MDDELGATDVIGPLWLTGLIRRRPARLVATALGVAVAVALLASIGTFLAATNAKMTTRAIARVPVDWQVQVQPGADPHSVLQAVRARSDVRSALAVQFVRAPGFSATTQGTTQTTGAGRVVGLPDGYGRAFPGQLRVLAGRGTGVLLFQQTAANLHARPGDMVSIGRSGTVRVDGVVDLPAEDSLFQQVGAPAGAQAPAPPDNVIFVSSAKLPSLTRGLPVTTQLHVRLSHALPGSPNSAFSKVSGAALNFETRLAGAGLVGDNLGAALDKARADALYADLLFLFLGAPGAVLAALVTAAVAAAGADRRRRDAALLRTRGATTAQLVRTAATEAVAAGSVGVVAGLGAALAIGALAFHAARFGASTAIAIAWGGGATAVGLAIAAATLVLPAWRDARRLTVAGQRRVVGREGRRRHYGLDVLCLAAAGLVYWQASRNGYQLVLAPEGVPQVSVNWYALLAPALAWIGGALLVHRVVSAFLERGRRPLRGALLPVAGPLAATVAAALSRQRRLLATAVTLLALAGAFAASTAVFNATYKQQAEVDARLTNGADVTVTESPGSAVGPDAAGALRRVAGVKSIEPLQHRFAYVGSDLQDLYGVRPDSIERAGRLQDAWFAGGSAHGLMQQLGRQPDAVLVSAETVHDFQLHRGDLIRLRLQDGRTKQYRTIPFHYVGVAKEFLTAPTDSFLVANADYIARTTGTPAIGNFLIQTDGSSPSTVAGRIARVVGPGAQVTNIDDQRRVVGSNLTAVELNGLTRVELGFALVLALAASGLTLALGFHERRRTYAIAATLGASQRQLGAFIWGEAACVCLGGLVLGAALATGIAGMLIQVLTGVFDPPPDVAAVPVLYLGAIVVTVLGGTLAAGLLTIRATRRPAIATLRDL